MIKRILMGLAALVVVALVGMSALVWSYNQSMQKKYDIPLPVVTLSTDPAVLAEGKHLAESLGGCASCHGADMTGGPDINMGPIGIVHGPNITGYNPAAMARLMRHGIKADNTSVTFMPVKDFNWFPDSYVDAVVSYIASLPVSKGEPTRTQIGAFGKVMDRLNQVELDMARIVDHNQKQDAPPPAPTKEYGKYVANLCIGCHGAGFSGGPMPGTPPDFPKPLNLTPHETGLKGWTYAEFDKLMVEGIRKNGKKLDPFMPTDATSKFNDTEKQALWAFLQSLPPTELGKR